MNIKTELGHHCCYISIFCDCGMVLEITDIHKDWDAIHCDYCDHTVGYRSDFAEKGIDWMWAFIKG